jgi:aquaporin Z
MLGAVIRRAREHWPEYLMEAAGLGVFMIVACLATAAIEHPGSPLRSAIASSLGRRALMGAAMGLTAIGIIYSPWGRRSGAHINPAVTLTFLRLGRVHGADALFYVVAQFAGGAAGVLLTAFVLGDVLAHPAVRYIVTAPGPQGELVAFGAELAISFFLMLVLLTLSSHEKAAPYTGLVAGLLVATYIAVEAPYSGMSMNPARTAASAVVARDWTAWWVYFVAPPIAMLLAAETYVRVRGWTKVACAKLYHARDARCIFCGFVPGVTASYDLSSRGEMP